MSNLFKSLILSASLIVAPIAVHAEMLDMPIVQLQSLDKITARTMVFEMQVGKTVKFGPIYIKAQACRKAEPIDTPESAAFLQIWEETSDEKSEWVFSGWMFASSPALSSMDHPVYDVWVLDCLESTDKNDGEVLDAPKGGSDLEDEEQQSDESEDLDSETDLDSPE